MLIALVMGGPYMLSVYISVFSALESTTTQLAMSSEIDFYRALEQLLLFEQPFQPLAIFLDYDGATQLMLLKLINF